MEKVWSLSSQFELEILWELKDDKDETVTRWHSMCQAYDINLKQTCPKDGSVTNKTPQNMYYK